MHKSAIPFALAAALAGCGDQGRPPLALTCVFSARSTSASVPGDAFTYVLHAPRTQSWKVVHGIAQGSEPLDSKSLSLAGDLPLLDARPAVTGIEWTELDSAGSEVVNWIAYWEPSLVGERFTHVGISHLSAIAYPACFAHEAVGPG